ncbi:MAG TPA: response regulator [Pelobium sp.]|jgi:CheY-like chemotaxis protein|nr:response regulator [Pelobium sp.]
MVKTTFIIDDDETYIYALKRLISIKKLSESVLSFKNGKLAINYFIETPLENITMPDVILLDVRMPIMDGWGFLEAFSALDFIGKHKVEIYMVSSSIDPRDLEKASNIALVKKYLFKPIDFDDVKLIFSKE